MSRLPFCATATRALAALSRSAAASNAPVLVSDGCSSGTFLGRHWRKVTVAKAAHSLAQNRATALQRYNVWSCVEWQLPPQ